MSVLVGYASTYGSTRSIAERIAARLTADGSQVELMPLDRLADAGGYDAAVLGSAVHGQAWLPEARRFVEANTATLASRPVWLFSVGMPAALRGPWRLLANKEEPKVTAGFREAIRARDHRLFSGVVRREHVPLVGHLLFRAMGCRYGDYRNWPEIDAWADDIAGQLTAGSPKQQVRQP